MEPVRKLRIFVAMAARLLPGVRCSTLCTVYSSPSWRMVIPGRNCVARISSAPDAYGILRQAVHTGCVPISRRLDGTGVGRPRNRKYKRPGIEWSTRRTKWTRNRLRCTPGELKNWHNSCGSPPKTLMKKPAEKTFQATLERFDSPLKWVINRIPFDAAKIWGKRGQLKVKGEINGFAFRTSLFPTGKGYHYLLVNKRMQAGAGARPGQGAQFRLEPDTEKRVATVPAELQRILNKDRSLRRWFDQLSYSIRK